MTRKKTIANMTLVEITARTSANPIHIRDGRISAFGKSNARLTRRKPSSRSEREIHADFSRRMSHPPHAAKIVPTIRPKRRCSRSMDM